MWLYSARVSGKIFWMSHYLKHQFTMLPFTNCNSIWHPWFCIVNVFVYFIKRKQIIFLLFFMSGSFGRGLRSVWFHWAKRRLSLLLVTQEPRGKKEMSAWCRSHGCLVFRGITQMHTFKCAINSSWEFQHC